VQLLVSHCPAILPLLFFLMAAFQSDIPVTTGLLA